MRRPALAVVLLTTTAGFAVAVEAPRPRGVGPEFAKFYKSGDDFSCILNPSIKISQSRINDEFCDCPDGSDEPGTAACAHLSLLSPQTPANVIGPAKNSTAALPGFYCKNKGHNPTYIPFTLVNDGICDYEVCCDGSDEWENAGGVKCEDKCKEIGKEWRKQDEARQKSRGVALRRRKELAAEAVKLKQDLKNRLSELVVQVEASEIKVKQLEKERDEIEKKEQSRVVKDAGKGGKIGVLAGLAKGKIEELQSELRLFKMHRDSWQRRTKDLEKILSAFKTEYNPNFNDEGVKRAVQAWEDYMTSYDPENEDEEDPTEPDMSALEDSISWEDFEEEDVHESDTDVLYKLEEYLPPSIRDWVDGKLRDLRTYLQDNNILARPSTSRPTTQSKALNDANTRLESARDDLKAQSDSKKEIEGDVDRDFGPEDVWRSLKGKCASLDSGEYTYEVCWMDRVTQKSKKGGQHDMGSFKRLDKTVVDEELKADGRGLGSGERVTMVFDDGAHCWNGPNRRSTVVLSCYEKEEVWKVSEEEKCVYRIEAGNPAVCGNESQATEGSGSTGEAKKDEL